MQVDLFDQELNAILAAPTYDEFATRLRAYDCRDDPRILDFTPGRECRRVGARWRRW